MPSFPTETPDDLSALVRYRDGLNRHSIGTAAFAAIALLQLAFTSCATYTPQPIDAGELATSPEQRTLDRQDVRDLAAANDVDVSEWPPAEWSPELLTFAALALSPSLEVARAEWSVVRASISTAGEIPNPSLVAGLEHKNDSGSLSPWVSSSRSSCRSRRPASAARRAAEEPRRRRRPDSETTDRDSPTLALRFGRFAGSEQ